MSLADDFAAMMFDLDIHYNLGEGHPLLGHRMPDLDLVTADGPLRVFELLRGAKPVLLTTSASPLASTSLHGLTGSADRRELRGGVGFPVLGVVTAPTAVLIRPDGYVAWVGDRTQLGLPEALTWFGLPAAA